ncbi:unnamed protein product [Linum tenue]|uniref:Uncharacterized protein n=1 Tax=Linum tenue TaxID=586396 RepID=A0AAV0RQI0_9ROSI|nr:unnamed protein product [Linum tenue]
MPWSGVSC